MPFRPHDTTEFYENISAPAWLGAPLDAGRHTRHPTMRVAAHVTKISPPRLSEKATDAPHHVASTDDARPTMHTGTAHFQLLSPFHTSPLPLFYLATLPQAP